MTDISLWVAYGLQGLRPGSTAVRAQWKVFNNHNCVILQDWNYLAGDCMELTLELSQHKWPAPQLLPQLFEDNLPAMLAYPLAGAFGGVW